MGPISASSLKLFSVWLVGSHAFQVHVRSDLQYDGGNLYHVTVATEPHGYLQTQELTSSALGLEHITLGSGANWTGLMVKVDLIKKWLMSQPNTSLVLLTDAYDVLVVANKAELVSKFYRFDADVVLGGTSNYADSWVGKLINAVWDIAALWDFCSLGADCSNVPSMGGLINSGAMIGYVGPLTDLWTRMGDLVKRGTLKEQSDQALLNSVSFEGIRIAMDTEHTLFWNWTPASLESLTSIVQLDGASDSVEDGLEIENGRVALTNSAVRPAVIHGLAHRNMSKLSTSLCETLELQCVPPAQNPKFTQNRYQVALNVLKLLMNQSTDKDDDMFAVVKDILASDQDYK